MTAFSAYALDNPVWYALNGFQSELGERSELASKFHGEILPFAAAKYANLEALAEIDKLLHTGDQFFLFGDLGGFPLSWNCLSTLSCLQMTLDHGSSLPKNASAVTILDQSHKDEIYQLVQHVQPGYFRRESVRLGNYVGIFEDGKLISVGGERLRISGFTEISAICTYAEYTGLGHARKIISHLCTQNLEIGNTPFLHVLETNTRAIRLYQMLGFQKRRVMPIRHFEKK